MTSDYTTAATADTIVLVHGLWLTAQSWEHWVKYYTDKGYNVLAPSYPGLEGDVDSLREDTSPIEALTMPCVVAHFEEIISKLDKPPILIGHSQGGVIVQILLDRGYGVAGVAIDSVPPEGVLVVPLTQLISLFPAFKNPANIHHAVGFSAEEFRYAFTNTMEDEEAALAYERYYIPAPGSFIFNGVLANLLPGHQATYVNFKNNNRAPLLLIAGENDHIMPPSVNKSNAHHYNGSKAMTDYHEFPGRCHFICGQEGWEEVADYALKWAKNHALTKFSCEAS